MLKNKLKSALFVVSALALILFYQNTSTLSSQPVTLNPTSGTPHVIPTSFLGLNVDNGFNDHQFPNWTNSTTTQVLETLGATNLRYPGGTQANYWDWQLGWITGSNDAKPNFSYMCSSKTNAGNSTDALGNFWTYLAEPTSAAPIFLLNVMTYQNTLITPANFNTYQTGMINYQKNLLSLAATKVPIQYVELGNEFNWGGLPSADHLDYLASFPTGTSYATEMNSWINAIRSSYPNVKIAVVGDPTANPGPTREAQWNSQVMNTVKGADAVTFHLYPGVPESGYPTESADAALAVAFSFWTPFQNQELAAIGSKEAWITEFDMTDYGLNCVAKPAPTENLYVGTWMHGLFVNQMITEMLSSPNIKLASFYNITQYGWCGQHNAYYMNSTNLGSGTAQMPSGSGVLSASGQVIALYSRALKNATSATSLTIPNVPLVEAQAVNGSTSKINSYPAVTGVRIDSQINGTQVVMANYSSQPFIVNISAIVPANAATIESLTGPSTLPAGVTSALPPLTNFVTQTSPAVVKTFPISGNFITLAPYSVSRIYNFTVGQVGGFAANAPLPTGGLALWGYACLYGGQTSLNVHIFSGGPVGVGTDFGVSSTSNLFESYAQAPCNDPTQTPHNFWINIEALVGATANPLYIYAIMPDTNALVPIAGGAGTFSTPVITGNIGGISNSATGPGFWGTSCIYGDSTQTPVQLYAGGAIGQGGLFIETITTPLVYSWAFNICNEGSAHSFWVPITSSNATSFGGKSIYAYGQNPTNGNVAALANSGTYSVPHLIPDLPIFWYQEYFSGDSYEQYEFGSSATPPAGWTLAANNPVFSIVSISNYNANKANLPTGLMLPLYQCVITGTHDYFLSTTGHCETLDKAGGVLLGYIFSSSDGGLMSSLTRYESPDKTSYLSTLTSWPTSYKYVPDTRVGVSGLMGYVLGP